MRDHLEEAQLRKLGLRFYLPAGDNSDITKRVEFCTPAHLDAFTHQIDRGRFENELFRRCRKQGADAFRGWRVQEIELGDDKHTINLSQEDDTATITARWIVDASGRSNLLRKKLDLGTETGHHINAAWFRLAGGLDFESWSDDEEWLGRMPERGLRRLSTTHLIDAGYWLWLIQLDSGPISIGVCADPRFHPFDEINSFEAFLDWMRRHEPQLAAEIEGRQEDVARLPAGRGLLVRVEPGLLGRSLDAGGRGGGLHRRALLAGLRLHRLHQHVQRRAHRARSGRRGHHGAAPTSTTTSSSGCSTRRSSSIETSTSCSATRR